MSRIEDLSGKKFGRLTVVSLERQERGVKWRCLCDCGNEILTITNRLKSGKTKSCGCLRTEMIVNRNKTHGCGNRIGYNRWVNMNARCYNENHASFSDYGAKGVTVCEEWRENPKAFCDWFDEKVKELGISERELQNYAIDKDVNSRSVKVYSPETCTIITRSENTLISNRGKMFRFRAFKNGVFIGIFDNQREFARKNNLNHRRVQECISGKKSEIDGFSFTKE